MQRSSESIASLAAAWPRRKSNWSIRRNRWWRPSVRMAPAGRNARSAMPRCRAGSTSCARPWASMRSPRCRRPRSTRPPASSISRPCWRILRGNGSPRTGRSAPISETATPHRMGAALTYARRYALFTLVGIAGEDDLDAPDLATPTKPASAPEKPKEGSNRRLNGGQRNPVQRSISPPRRKDHATSANPILGPEASAELRDRLLAELDDLGSADDAAIWAHRNLRAKNDLTAADARRVEEAFHARLATFGEPALASRHSKPLAEAAADAVRIQARQDDRPRSKVIDKSVLALPEPRRVRDREHVRSVAKQPCLICGRQPCGCPPSALRSEPSARAQGER